MTEQPNSIENISEQESLEKIKEILESLENSPAVKMFKMFDFKENDIGGRVGLPGGLEFSQENLEDVLNHPDVKMYIAIKNILDRNTRES